MYKTFLYQADAGDLVFFLRDAESDKATQSTRLQTRLAYWTQALPTIQQQNLRWGIAGALREWCVAHGDQVQLHPDKCGALYTRFTTEGMREILPDLENTPSGWGTPNHYFYEIVNRDGKEVTIQLSLSSRNMSPELLSQCERIDQFYPSRHKREDWQWRMPFKTKPVSVCEPIDRTLLFKALDERLQEILAFEQDLKAKLQMN